MERFLEPSHASRFPTPDELSDLRIREEMATHPDLLAAADLIFRDIDLLTIPPTPRSYREYQELLCFTPEQLGNVVMDLGSGMRNNFSRAVENMDKTVISVNPLLMFAYDRRLLHAKSEEGEAFEGARGLVQDTGPTVAAVAEALPFTDNTFDSVVSSYAVPYYLEPYRDQALYDQSLREVCRVLKPGGVFLAGPITSPHMLSAALDRLSAEGLPLDLNVYQLEDDFTVHITKTAPVR